MYLINPITLQRALQLFIAVSRYRTAQSLVGPRDGVNHLFHAPANERFVHNLPFLTPAIYLNGVRQEFLEDYVLLESGGPGTGYDTVSLVRAPRHDDGLVMDYVVT